MFDDNINIVDDNDYYYYFVGTTTNFYYFAAQICDFDGCGDFVFDNTTPYRVETIDKRSDLEAKSGSNGKRRV